MSSNAPSSAERPLKGLSVETARGRMLEHAPPLPAETVPLAEATNRVLAAPVLALRDQPPFAASAMDGWAVRDLSPSLRIVGESAAGRGYSPPLKPGETVRIFTGAPVPEGASQVVIQEEAARDGDRLHPVPAPGAPSYIRPRGLDFQAGQTLLQTGDVLDPWRLSLAAAAGAAALSVRRRPRVAILSGGDELAAPGQTPGPWAIFDSAAPALAALVEQWGATAVRAPPLSDSVAAIVAAVGGIEADLIVTIGGASVGDHDLVKPALRTLGLELAVETVNVRPGKPTWFGALADGRPVLGLPGNPASAFVCAELFLRPLLSAMLGRDPQPTPIAARLEMDLPANGPREHWMRAALRFGEDGALHVRPFSDQDSSLVSVFAQADALLGRAPDAPLARIGDIVAVLPLRRG